MKNGYFNQHILRYILLPVVLIGISFSFSVEQPDKGCFKDGVKKHFQQLADLHCEKLYLHLDKPYYVAGEDIWFKGYLWTQMLSPTDEFSNFIYLELADRYDSIVIRRKFARDSIGQFKGNFALPTQLPEGQYCLRAYTRWMQNVGPQHFFMRNLLIGTPLPKLVRAEVNYVKISKDELEATIQLLENEKPLAGQPLFCNINSHEPGKKAQSRRLKTDQSGIVRFRVDPSSRRLKNSKPAIDILLDSETYHYQQSFPIPSLEPDFAVTFFPEGGPLLSEIEQRVAFKAQNEYGFGEEVSGAILTSLGDTLTTFKTEHAGMGQFSLKAPAALPLRAVVTNASGLEKEFLLPAAESDRFAMRVINRGNQVLYQVMSGTTAAWNDSLFVVAHAGEQLCYLQAVTAENSSGAVDISVFPQGIVRFVLANSSGIPVSERLLFLYPTPRVNGKIVNQTPKPATRQLVELELELADLAENPVQAELSVSVTDRNLITPDLYADNIFTHLLLTSDLTQGIENPGYYFFSDNPQRQAHLDLLMMTHGWSRFYGNTLLSANQPEVKFKKEVLQEITGKINSVFNKPVKNTPVGLFIPKDSVVAMTETDDRGKFIFQGLGHKDTCDMYVSFMGKGNKKLFEVNCNKEVIPPFVNKNPLAYLPKLNLPANLLKNMQEEVLDSLDLIAHQLKEVVVEGRASFDWCDLRDNEYILENETKHFSAWSLRRPANQTALDAILTLPGMTLRSTADSYLSGKKFYYGDKILVVYVNDVLVDIDTDLALDLIPFSDIEELSLYTVISPYSPADELYFFAKVPNPERHAFGSLGRYDMLRIKLKRDSYKYTKRATPWMQRFVSLGYIASKQRYEPVYVTPEMQKSPNPDRRSTIHWNPSLFTSPEGKAKIRFYTSDSPENYHIIIEGATFDGDFVFMEQDL